MRAAARIAGNTSVILFGKIAGVALSIATVFILTAHLSLAEFGHYNFVFFYIGIFSVITEMGMSPILIREMARNRQAAGEILGVGMIVKVFLAAGSFAAALLFLPFIQQDDNLYRLVFILGWQLFSYPLLACVNIFKLELKMVYPTVIDLSRNTVYLLGVLYVVRTERLGLSHLFALAVATSFVIALILLILSRRYVQIRFRWRPELAKQLIRASIPLGISQLAIICYYRVDTIMLLRMKGEEALGYYSLAVKISEGFSYIPSAFMVSVYPFLSRFWHENQEKFLHATELSLRTLLVLGLPIGIMGSIFAPQIVQIIPGAYEPAANSLVYLIWAEVFIFLNTVLYNAINAMNRERWNLLTTAIMLGGNILLNLALIPQYSHAGASFATLTTEACGFILLGTLLLVSFGFRRDIVRRSFRTLAAGGTVALILWAISRHETPSILSAAILMMLGALAYLGLLLALRVVNFQEIRDLLHPQGKI